MNLKELREIVGTVVVFRPRPKINSNLIKEAYNSWIIMNEVDEKKFLFKNTNTNHEIVLGTDNINQFRSPCFLILRGQLSLKDEGQVEFEPFSAGLSDEASTAELADETSRLKGNPLYEALKPHEGKPVTLRFPDKGDWKFGPDEAILEKVTLNFMTVRRPESRTSIELPFKLPDQDPMTIHVPEKVTSVPLAFVSIAEDVEEKRPMIVFDHSFWESEL